MRDEMTMLVPIDAPHPTAARRTPPCSPTRRIGPIFRPVVCWSWFRFIGLGGRRAAEGWPLARYSFTCTVLKTALYTLIAIYK